MPYKILFADDSRMINEVMNFTFEKNGFEIITCNSINEIEEKTKNFTFDIIIISQKLNGIELTKKLKNNGININAQFFILSDKTDINIKKKAKNSKVDGWIIKPFIPEKLTRAIKYHMLNNQ